MKDKELQLQRLVDGQLNRQQIQSVLQHAEDQPELWREIAAAFVEDQIWRSEIRADSTDALSLATIEKSPSASDVPTTKQRKGPESSQTVRYNGFSGTKFWLSLAAATLLGLWLGGNWDRFTDSDSNKSNTIAKEDAADSAPSIEGISSSPMAGSELADNGQHKMFKPVHHLSMGEAGNIPLYTIEEARKMGMTFDSQELPDDMVAKYQEKGYQVRQNTQYISGSTNDGRRVLVPVRSVSIDPGN